MISHRCDASNFPGSKSSTHFVAIPSPPAVPPPLSFHALSFTPHPTQLGELSAELEDKYRAAHPDLCSLKDALHVPDIIHSTVMRIANQPCYPAERRLTEELAELGARWEAATVRVGAMSLVHENHPYMHLRRDKNTHTHSYPLPFLSC